MKYMKNKLYSLNESMLWKENLFMTKNCRQITLSIHEEGTADEQENHHRGSMKQSLAAATTEEKIESEMVSLFDRRQNEGLF